MHTPQSTQELRSDYLKIVEKHADLDSVGRRIASEYMCNSEAVYKGEVADFLYVPKLYTPREIKRFQEIARTTYGILEKVTAAYVADPEYRKFYDFSPELEKLILHDPRYAVTIPMIRMDIFFDEDSGDFKFCEFNTDGSSAMCEDREASAALQLTPSFSDFKFELARQDRHIEPFELFESWVNAFLEVYSQTQRAKTRPQPTVAITDFMDISTPVEIERFAKHFAARGLTVEVCDVRELRTDRHAEGGPVLLTPKGTVVDAVYRRAVTCDIMKHYDQVQDFIEAYLADAFVLVGSFRTQLPHTKLSFEVLHRPETLALLSAEEQDFVRAHVPYTVRLSPDVPELADIVARKDSWIIKPLDSYGSKGVWSGREFAQADWEGLIADASADGDHIAQHYIDQYEAANLECGFDLPAHEKPIERDELPAVKSYRDLTGLFVYNGEFQGFLARAGRQDRICAAAAGKCLGTFKVY